MMGVTVNSVKTRMEIQRLLHESQVMNEELQVQSEELQTQSEEMQMQTEELQSQTSELLTVNKELENQKYVAENAAIELERYNEQLEQSSRYKSEFLANMSHEPADTAEQYADSLTAADGKPQSYVNRGRTGLCLCHLQFRK